MSKPNQDALLKSSSTPPPPAQDESAFYQLSTYPFSSDSEFQSGLSAILGPNPSPEQAERLTLRAQCFYFSRKNNIPIDFNAYQSWRTVHPSSLPLKNNLSTNSISSTEVSSQLFAQPRVVDEYESDSRSTSSREPSAPYPKSFTQIIELITNGGDIPGMRKIPETVLEGQASMPMTAKRKKPWEEAAVKGNDADANGIAS